MAIEAAERSVPAGDVPAAGNWSEARDRVGGVATAIARAVAVLGSDASIWAVAELTELELAEVLAGVDILVGYGLVADRNPLALAGPDTAAAVLDDIPFSARVRAHLDSGRILRDSGADAERIAAQLLQAGPTGLPWAASVYRAAAAGARRRGDGSAAERYLSQTLTERLSPGERAAVLRDTAEVRAIADPTEAIGDLLHELEWMQPSEVLSTVPVLRRILAASPKRDDVLWALDHATERVGERTPTAAAQLQLARGMVLATHANGVTWMESAASWLESRLSEWPQLGLHLAAIRCSLATLQGNDAVVARTNARTVLGQADPRSEFDACWHALMTSVFTEHPDDAEATCRRLQRELGGHEDEWKSLSLSLLRAEARRRAGDIKTTTASSGALLERLDRQHTDPMPSLRTCAAGLLAESLIQAGDTARAETVLREYGLFGAPADESESTFTLHVRGLLLAACGDVPAAVEAQLECGRHLANARTENPDLIRWRYAAVWGLMRLDRRDQAIDLAEENLELARRWRTPGAVGIAYQVLASTRPNRDRIEPLSQAIELLEVSGYQLDQAIAHYELGKAMRSTERDQAAHHHFLRALAIAEQVGAERLAERARAMTGPGSSTGRAKGLTAQEWKIAQLVAGGMSNPQIAAELFLARRTVEFHLSSVYRKLALSGRGDLAELLGGTPAVNGRHLISRPA
ncbi:helix-turn-helix transcriptional regulator [Kribbella sp. NPDC056861]|uniref:helix-turn-helix transcriptional regulator n=1 Tax=Kribbella sp. NPDC056861 TaxID=3154857 RepID=UPI00343A6144